VGRSSSSRARKISSEAREIPAPPISRDAAKQQTRDALVAAALELFVEQGLSGPSLDAICERAGFTRGAFYVHFADRDALLVAAMERVGEEFLANVFAHVSDASDASTREESGRLDALRSGESPRSAVVEVTHRFVDAVAAGAYPLLPPEAHERKTAYVRPHQLIEACARSAVVRERYKALVEASIAHIAELASLDQWAGAIRQDLDPRLLGTTLLALILGAQTMAEIGVPIEPAKLARSVLSMILPAS
jgi:AcrR family transcriptional regulator